MTSCQSISEEFQGTVWKNWKFLVLVLSPILLLPLLIVQEGIEDGNTMPTTKLKCAYVILLMGIYWTLEIIPLPVTAFLPVVLFPLFGVQDTSYVSKNYMRDGNMMFIGGLVMALSVQFSKLHKRIAINSIAIMGHSVAKLSCLMFLFSICLSIWFSNLAAAAIVIPIISELFKLMDSKEEKNDQTQDCQIRPQSNFHYGDRRLLVSALLGLNLGGIFLPYSSAPSHILYRLTKPKTHPNYTEINRNVLIPHLFHNSHNLSLASWMAFAAPILLVCFFIYLTFEIGRGFSFGRKRTAEFGSRQTLPPLDPMTFQEMGTLCLGLLLFLLWFFRDPRFLQGFLPQSLHSIVDVGDSAPAMFVVLLFFILPRNPFGVKKEGEEGFESLLDWKYVQRNLPWGIILLMGSGFAMADASKVSGLSKYILDGLEGLKGMSDAGILFIVLIITLLCGEVCSNTAAGYILLPIFYKLSERLGFHPLYLALPAALISSTTFLCPAGSPTNAFVFSSTSLTFKDGLKRRVGLEVTAFAAIYIAGLFYAPTIFT